MRIALVSYEFPPDTGYGGIGTYVQQAAALLVHRGHRVEVFAASRKRSGHFESGNLSVNLIGEMDRSKFRDAIAPIFSQRDAICDFEVIESPEYFADGREILKLHPKTPHVVKLHTPNQLIRECNSDRSLSSWLHFNLGQFRVMAGALRRGKRPPRYQTSLPLRAGEAELHSVEKNYVKKCTFITSPSRAMVEWAIREWEIDRKKTMVVPNPYVPCKELLEIPAVMNRKIIGFFGRLEYRKGVYDLVEAIPKVLKTEPDALFRFVGSPQNHPITNESSDAFILRKLRKFRRNILMVGAKGLHEMPSEYDKVDICVFPSVWENFPNVCLEAMSAGKAVVASESGGMAEILDANCGLLVPSKDPKAIADSIVRLLRSNDLRLQLGCISRKRVLERYSVESVGPQIESSYAKAIAISLSRMSEPDFHETHGLLEL